MQRHYMCGGHASLLQWVRLWLLLLAVKPGHLPAWLPFHILSTLVQERNMTVYSIVPDLLLCYPSPPSAARQPLTEI